jgi:hypothetical protein
LPTSALAGAASLARGRSDDDVAAVHPFAEAVVGVADEDQAQPWDREGAETLAGAASDGEVHRTVGKSRVAVRGGDLARDVRAERAIGVPDQCGASGFSRTL